MLKHLKQLVAEVAELQFARLSSHRFGFTRVFLRHHVLMIVAGNHFFAAIVLRNDPFDRKVLLVWTLELLVLL